jgi:hypothetical protein
MGGPKLAATVARGTRALIAVAFAAGCAGDLALGEEGYRHRRHGYTVGVPEPVWERVSIDGATLAFRRGRETMSLQSRCGRPVATPAIMARQLVIGIGDRELHRAGPVTVDGREGWAQTFDARAEGGSVRVKTVTLVAGRCTFDWTLAGSADFAGAERSFDAWWQSFRLTPGAVAEGGPR